MTTEIKASHILIKTEEEAINLKERIIAGEAFGTIAAENSICPSARNGGDLGFFGRGQMVREFEDAAFGLNVGEISDPVKTNFGWHLILVTDKE